ncbi:hypothetical protein, partial [Escherichia coli]|uniref:hypothetical protein n=1 Tax=Escherichia coli TaxID=562 RepID=UPI0039DF8838
QWQVVWTESGVVKRSLTARGNRLVELQQVAAGFVDEWVQTLNRGDLLGAWAGTLPFAERPSLAQRYASRLV